jgi:hypothetical protein
MNRLREILESVSYKAGWSFHVNEAAFYFQVELPVDHDGKRWRGRKWMISTHMTEGEVVQTALAACLMAEEHEAREAFRYKGRALFGPHIDVNRLMEVADQIVRREP